MGKFVKILLGLVALLVVVIVAAAIILPMVVDPNDYKDEIAATVEKQTGRTLSLQGDIGLSVFPWLGLDIGPATISNAAGFEEPHMASMEAVQVRVKLLPLLRKQLEVDKVKLTGLQLLLARDKSGKTNWDDLTGAAETQTKPDDSAGAPDEAITDGALDSLAIGGIEVTKAQLVWDDQTTGSRYEVSDLAFTTGSIEPDEAFDLDLHFQLNAKQPAISGTFELSGGVLIAPGLKAVEITAATLVINADGEAIPGGHQTATLATDIALNLEAQTLLLPNIVLEAAGMVLNGNVSGNAISGDDPEFNGLLNVAEFSPRGVIGALGLEAPVTADSAVLAKAALVLEWDASLQHVAVTRLNIQLDDTSLNGTAQVKSFDAPAITFELAADEFNLDRYLPPAAEPAVAAAGKSGKEDASAEAEPLPLDSLRSLNLDGKLTVGRLQAFNLRTRDAELQVKTKDGVLRFNPLGAMLYDGSYRGDITLDFRKDTPRIAVNERLAEVQAGPLLKDLTGKEHVSGKANITAQMKAQGVTSAAIRNSLNGDTSFSFTDGAVKGVNIAALIRSAQARLKGQAVPDSNQPTQTDFSAMGGTARVTNGLIRNDDFSLQSPLLRLSGAGEVSLPKETIDYTLTTKIIGSLEGQGGKGLAEVKGVAIPVHVGGTFDKPTYAPDLEAALSGVAQEKIDQELDKQKEKLQEKLGDKLKDLFH
jgi:AsmA protein